MTARSLLSCTAILLLCAPGGCATVLSGYRQKIGFVSDPTAAEVVVIGGPVGEYILDAKKQSDRVQAAVWLLKKVAPESYAPGIEKLERLSADELVPKLALWLRFNRVPEELASLGPFAIPATAETALMEMLGIGPSGTTPYEGYLRKGTRYAVIAWKDGCHGKIVPTDESFNWLFLLNILNAFLLCPVDIASGAWFDVEPERVEIRLEPEAPRAQVPPPQAQQAQPPPTRTGRTSTPRR